MYIVLDTNILVSAQMFGGKPRTIFELAIFSRHVTAYTSPWLIDEYIGILERKFDYDKYMGTQVRKLLSSQFQVLIPQQIPSIITDDPSDNQVLAVTHETSIDSIISGDNHLLKLRYYNHIPIINPDQFLECYAEAN